MTTCICKAGGRAVLGLVEYNELLFVTVDADVECEIPCIFFSIAREIKKIKAKQKFIKRVCFAIFFLRKAV